MIDIKNFNSKLLIIGKKWYKNIDICYVGYIRIKNNSDYENINSVNPLYLIIGEVDEYNEQSNENIYLSFASTDKNKCT